jgi:alginate O-acetyltransferase complex protein AlgJ
MRIASIVRLAVFVLASACANTRAEVELSPAQQSFRDQLAAKVSALDTKNLAALAGKDGWLFLASELRYLAHGQFWGEGAGKASRTRNAKAADPLPAITDFHRQLNERGIRLLVVPVPAKAAILPDKIGIDAAPSASETAPFQDAFYRELRRAGIDVLDLTASFSKGDQRGPVYCRTDSHWSGVGCFLAAQAIAQEIRKHLAADQPRSQHQAEWKEISVIGDLAPLTGGANKPAPEQISIRQVTGATGADPNSPVLVLGDSHTLVFHEFLAERAGLIDQLAAELGVPVDLIGTRGSGATPVRVSMYRRSRSEPEFLAKKKVVVWCFAAREFTEADQGWVVQPIAK